MNTDIFGQTSDEAPTENTEVLNAFGKRKLTDYEAHRYWLLHEVRQWRAMRRNGGAPKTAQKALQREMAKLRRIR